MDERTIEDQYLSDKGQESIDADNTIKEEVMVPDALPHLTIAKVTPAQVIGFDEKYVEQSISYAKQYMNIVVTKDNMKDMKDKLATLRKEKTAVNDAKKKVKSRVMEDYKGFEDNIKKVLKAFDESINNINKQVKVFEDEETEARKKQRQEVINEMIEKCLHEKRLVPHIANQFEFDDKWLNKSYNPTKTGAKTKFVKEVEMQLKLLEEKTAHYYINAKNLMVQLAKIEDDYRLIHGSLNAYDYTKLLENDSWNLEKVLERAAQDAKAISDVAAANIQAKQEEEKQVEKVEISDEGITVKKDEEMFKAEKPDMSKIPVEYQEKIYEYTYTFKGPCQSIMQLKNCLDKLVEDNNGTFTYERIK